MIESQCLNVSLSRNLRLGFQMVKNVARTAMGVLIREKRKYIYKQTSHS